MTQCCNSAVKLPTVTVTVTRTLERDPISDELRVCKAHTCGQLTALPCALTLLGGRGTAQVSPPAEHHAENALSLVASLRTRLRRRSLS